MPLTTNDGPTKVPKAASGSIGVQRPGARIAPEGPSAETSP